MTDMATLNENERLRERAEKAEARVAELELAMRRTCDAHEFGAPEAFDESLRSLAREVGAVLPTLGMAPPGERSGHSVCTVTPECGMCGGPLPAQEITLGAVRVCSLDCAQGAERMQAASSIDDFEDAVNAYETGIQPEDDACGTGAGSAGSPSGTTGASPTDESPCASGKPSGSASAAVRSVSEPERDERGMPKDLDAWARWADASRIATPAEESAALRAIGDLMMNTGLDHEWNPAAIVEAVRHLANQKDPDCIQTVVPNECPKCHRLNEEKDMVNSSQWNIQHALRCDGGEIPRGVRSSEAISARGPTVGDLAKKDPYHVHPEGPVAPDVLWVLITEIRGVANTRKAEPFTSQAAAETAFRESAKYTGQRARLFSYGVLAEWTT